MLMAHYKSWVIEYNKLKLIKTITMNKLKRIIWQVKHIWFVTKIYIQIAVKYH